MKKLGLLLCMMMLSGCQLTTFASDFLADMKDSNQYEQARETAVNICDPDVLDRLDGFLGKDTTGVIQKKCSEKRQTPQPLN